MADAKRATKVDPGITLAMPPGAEGPRDPHQVVPESTPDAAVEVTSPVRLDQLADELGEGVVLSAHGDPAAASAEAPVVVFVEGGGPDVRALLAAVKKHEPDDDWAPQTAS